VGLVNHTNAQPSDGYNKIHIVAIFFSFFTKPKWTKRTEKYNNNKKNNLLFRQNQPNAKKLFRREQLYILSGHIKKG
jgi:hypothetical protein